MIIYEGSQLIFTHLYTKYIDGPRDYGRVQVIRPKLSDGVIDIDRRVNDCSVGHGDADVVNDAIEAVRDISNVADLYPLPLHGCVSVYKRIWWWTATQIVGSRRSVRKVRPL